VRGSRLLIVATLRTKRPLFEKKRFLAREGAYISLSPYTRRGLIAQIALSQCEGVYSTHRCHPIQKEVSLTKEPPSCDGIYALLAPYIRRGFLHVKWSILFEGGNDACIGWQRCHPIQEKASSQKAPCKGSLAYEGGPLIYCHLYTKRSRFQKSPLACEGSLLIVATLYERTLFM